MAGGAKNPGPTGMPRAPLRKFRGWLSMTKPCRGGPASSMNGRAAGSVAAARSVCDNGQGKRALVRERSHRIHSEQVAVNGNEIRRTFLDYFAGQGHRVVRSSSLVPAGDPTLLFTNAGMNQFKDVFLGLERRDYNRATTVQKCVRAGGKHNDLENVGRTARHHTFFEMLGNFSFGDYFKKEAIAFAWELVTSPEWFAIPKDRLYATIFKGEQGIPRDAEAYEHWLGQGVPKERIYEFGSSENFWAMGDTGPCGPCSEIHYDMGPAASDEGHTDCAFGCDCGRYVEIWNLVFMQFLRDASGELQPLPKPSIDTGAGLERLAAVMLNLKDPKRFSNYDTDLLRPLITFGSELCGKPYGEGPRTDMALRVIADHSRAATFLVSDGVMPSNEGRGYVLRKIIRRGCDFGRQLGRKTPFLFVMAGHVADLMREPYPDVMESSGRVARIIIGEEEKYQRLVVPAEEQLVKKMQGRLVTPHDDAKLIREEMVDKGLLTKREAEKAEKRILLLDPRGRLRVDGPDLFYAYSTLGLRRDQVEDIAAARGWVIDPDANEKFEELIEKERERAKASWKGVSKEAASPIY